ncbi:MAG: HypC/HybG/HupF family hydrogenase formation chaperone [Candidatus Diapherotrites archaeon]
MPGKIVELRDNGKIAVIDYGFEKREANNEFLKAKKGEWVLVQFRMTVQKVSEKEALEALKEWKEVSGQS